MQEAYEPIQGDLERNQLSLAEVFEDADDELLRVNRIRSARKSKTSRKPGQRSGYGPFQRRASTPATRAISW